MKMIFFECVKNNWSEEGVNGVRYLWPNNNGGLAL